jgi:hypothetical protein
VKHSLESGIFRTVTTVKHEQDMKENSLVIKMHSPETLICKFINKDI